MPFIVACSIVAAALSGVGTYVLLTRMADAYERARAVPIRVPTQSPFATAEETRTDLIPVSAPEVIEHEPAIELRLAWHIARRAHDRRHHAT